MSTVVWVIIAIIVILVIWVIAIYNKFITLRVRSEEAWSDIDVQMKRRYDLIPNLIDTVKGYAKHEKELFERVTEARANAISASNVDEHAKAEGELSKTIKSIFAVAEAYPDLKANENFAKLQDELTDTEDKIQAARRFYNGNVRELNIAIQSFPSSVIAGMFKFEGKQLFELTESAAREPVKVDFNK